MKRRNFLLTNMVECYKKGECKFMGHIVEFAQFSVYSSGDTILFEGLEEILKPHNLDIAFLPFYGNKPESKQITVFTFHYN